VSSFSEVLTVFKFTTYLIETSFFYFYDALIIGHFGLKSELLTSSPTQFETFSDTPDFTHLNLKESLDSIIDLLLCYPLNSLKLLLHNSSPFFLRSQRAVGLTP